MTTVNGEPGVLNNVCFNKPRIASIPRKSALFRSSIPVTVAPNVFAKTRAIVVLPIPDCPVNSQAFGISSFSSCPQTDATTALCPTISSKVAGRYFTNQAINLDLKFNQCVYRALYQKVAGSKFHYLNVVA